MTNKCDCCGRFTKVEDLKVTFGEGEEWFECIKCMSEVDLKEFKLNRKKRND